MALKLNPTLLKTLLGLPLLLLLCITADAKDIFSAKALIKSAGLEQNFTNLPVIFNDDLNKIIKKRPNISKKFKSSWRSAVKSELNPEKMISQLETALSGQFTQQEQLSLKIFLTSNLGKRLTALENEAHANQDEISNNIQAILSKGKRHPQRYRLYQEIDRAIQGTKNGTNLALNIQMAGQIGMFASGKLTIPGLTLEKLSMLIERGRPRLTKIVQKYLMANMIETYKTVSDKDMKRYRNFLVSGAGKKFYDLLNAAQERIMVEATMNFGKTLMVLLKSNPI